MQYIYKLFKKKSKLLSTSQERLRRLFNSKKSVNFSNCPESCNLFHHNPQAWCTCQKTFILPKRSACALQQGDLLIKKVVSSFQIPYLGTRPCCIEMEKSLYVLLQPFFNKSPHKPTLRCVLYHFCLNKTRRMNNYPPFGLCHVMEIM